ncbi:hypothetical protein C0991_002338 [Blastosporella zonata]|nr:hypothetical protein C0991_002338 [Blastosporella zonata]
MSRHDSQRWTCLKRNTRPFQQRNSNGDDDDGNEYECVDAENWRRKFQRIAKSSSSAQPSTLAPSSDSNDPTPANILPAARSSSLLIEPGGTASPSGPSSINHRARKRHPPLANLQNAPLLYI